jgi:hypothetical protein
MVVVAMWLWMWLDGCVKVAVVNQWQSWLCVWLWLGGLWMLNLLRWVNARTVKVQNTPLGSSIGWVVVAIQCLIVVAVANQWLSDSG